MLKELPGRESLQHICDGVSRVGLRSQMLKIMLHDVRSYAADKSGMIVDDVKYCPYCGVEVEKEERP